MRSYVIFGMLLALKYVARLFYRSEMSWVGEVPENPWREIRVVAFLNHTSLFEPVFITGVPNHFLWRVARHGVVPAADKTIARPIVGKLFRFVAHHVVPISRQRDHTWFAVLQKIDPQSMVILFPEGRMMRANGLDKDGQPMTVRGGIVDILESVGKGRMLLAYSTGLHHVQVPGQRNFNLFETVRMKLEAVEITEYRRAIVELYGEALFKRGVVTDMERRREIYCYENEEEEPATPALVVSAD